MNVEEKLLVDYSKKEVNEYLEYAEEGNKKAQYQSDIQGEKGMKKKVLIAVVCIIIGIRLLVYWSTTSEAAYEKDMDAIQKMIDIVPNWISNQNFRSDIEAVKVVTKEAKKFKEVYLKIIDLRILRTEWVSESYGIVKLGAELKTAKIDVEMEQHRETMYEYLEEFIEAAEDVDVGEYSLNKFINFVYEGLGRVTVPYRAASY